MKGKDETGIVYYIYQQGLHLMMTLKRTLSTTWRWEKIFRLKSEWGKLNTEV
jgi:hypothetical protein